MEIETTISLGRHETEYNLFIETDSDGDVFNFYISKEGCKPISPKRQNVLEKSIHPKQWDKLNDLINETLQEYSYAN